MGAEAPRGLRRSCLYRAAWLAAGTLLLAGGLVGYEWNRRRGLYWYDVRQDYRYTLADDEMARVTVEVSADGFTLPASAHPWHTALLRLRISSTPLGRWFEPSVRVTVDGQPAHEQFFERGARGVRYLNLGARAGAFPEGTRVRLAGRHLRWKPQSAELLLFGGPDPAAGPILVLAPHPDDAEIAAFGLYAGGDTWVVTVTTGSYPGEAYRDLVAGDAAREALQARLRVWDSLVVPWWGGVPPRRAVNLGYFTNALEEMRRAPGRIAASPLTGTTDIAAYRALNASDVLTQRPSLSTWDNLVGDLAHLLDEAGPRTVVTPHPALDANRDHQLTTSALLEAMATSEAKPVTLLLYTNHHVLTEYFPFGPSGGLVTLPPWFEAAVPFGGVYSHPVTPRLQTDKLFALDAQHDLRPAPELVLGGPLPRIADRLFEALAAVWRDPAREHSYLRRAVRANELFFLYQAEDAPALRQLAGPATAPDPDGRR